ncbi:hypothetical protein Cgig2_011777 [Carnegiea gigantea]|uniref:Uncharacterized protein n=1 Tax=Carnegiea gigantea TaxID=171969 RepID=A0A9Q1GXI0_9CARY|nr:hypothetical protein Cgig2_011777 [Carnegiea gigantea]
MLGPELNGGLRPFLLERVWGHGYQEFSKEFCAALMPASVALMLGFSCPLSSCDSLSFYFRVGFFQLAPQVPLLGLLGLLLLLRLLPACSACRSPICPRSRASELSRSWIRFSRDEIDGVDITTFNARAKAWQIAQETHPYLNIGHLLLGDLGWLRRAGRSQGIGLSQVFHQSRLSGEVSLQEVYSSCLGVH